MSRQQIAVLVATALVAGAAIAFVAAGDQGPSRQELVAERGAEVMPFSLDATTHVFDATARGGTQRVIADDPEDSGEIGLIREHLREEADAFRRGDFGDPAEIHGESMPGLDALEAGYEDFDIRYRRLPDGAVLTYRTDDIDLAAALQAWFDAQLGDHADDATTSSPTSEEHASHSDHGG